MMEKLLMNQKTSSNSCSTQFAIFEKELRELSNKDFVVCYEVKSHGALFEILGQRQEEYAYIVNVNSYMCDSNNCYVSGDSIVSRVKVKVVPGIALYQIG